MPLQLNIGPVPPARTQAHAQPHTQGTSEPSPASSFLSSPHARPLVAPEFSLSTNRILRLLGLPTPDSAPALGFADDVTAPRHKMVARDAPPQGMLAEDNDLVDLGDLKDLVDLVDLGDGLQERGLESDDLGQADDLGQTNDLGQADDLGAGLQDEDDSLVGLLLRAEEEEERGFPARSAGAEEEDRGFPVVAAGGEDGERGFPVRSAGDEEDADWGDLSQLLQGYLSQTSRGVARETRRTGRQPTDDHGYQGDQELQSILGLLESVHQDSTETAES